jgi:hypothetical protein
MNPTCHPFLLFCRHEKTMTSSCNACCCLCGVVSQERKNDDEKLHCLLLWHGFASAKKKVMLF